MFDIQSTVDGVHMESGLCALLDVVEELKPEHELVTILLRKTEEQNVLEMLQRAENVTLSRVHLLEVLVYLSFVSPGIWSSQQNIAILSSVT